MPNQERQEKTEFMTNVKIQPKIMNESKSLMLRQGTGADSYSIFKVFEESLADLNQRFGSTTPTSWQEPAALARMWEQRRSLYEHLANRAEHFWVAEENGEIITGSFTCKKCNCKYPMEEGIPNLLPK